jgi:hypothetical protein
MKVWFCYRTLSAGACFRVPEEKTSFFATASRMTPLFIWKVLGGSLKWSKREADHPPSSLVTIKKTRKCTLLSHTSWRGAYLSNGITSFLLLLKLFHRCSCTSSFPQHSFFPLFWLLLWHSCLCVGLEVSSTCLPNWQPLPSILEQLATSALGGC